MIRALGEGDFSGLGGGLAFQPVRNRFNPVGRFNHLFKGASIRKMGPPLGRWIHLKPCWEIGGMIMRFSFLDSLSTNYHEVLLGSSIFLSQRGVSFSFSFLLSSSFRYWPVSDCTLLILWASLLFLWSPPHHFAKKLLLCHTTDLHASLQQHGSLCSLGSHIRADNKL